MHTTPSTTPQAPSATPRSWKPVVKVAGEPGWHSNGLRFATQAEAEQSASDVFYRWMACTGYSAQPSEDEPNYRLVDGKLVALVTLATADAVLDQALADVGDEIIAEHEAEKGSRSRS